LAFAEASTVRRSIKESLSDDRLSEADAEIIANSCSDNALRRKAVGFGEKCHGFPQEFCDAPLNASMRESEAAPPVLELSLSNYLKHRPTWDTQEPAEPCQFAPPEAVVYLNELVGTSVNSRLIVLSTKSRSSTTRKCFPSRTLTQKPDVV